MVYIYFHGTLLACCLRRMCCKSVGYILSVCDRSGFTPDDCFDTNAQQVQGSHVSGRCYEILLSTRRRVHVRAFRGGAREVPDTVLIIKVVLPLQRLYLLFQSNYDVCSIYKQIYININMNIIIFNKQCELNMRRK